MTDTTDRELLELAAKAAGIVGNWERRPDHIQERWYFNVPYDNQGMLTGFEWNPLTDDGDEARLEASLSLDVEWHPRLVLVGPSDGILCAEHYKAQQGDRQAARRKAGVRAAAEIGKAMP